METPKSRRRMLIGGAGVLAGAAAATVLNPFTAAQAQQSTDPTAWYVLVNRSSGKVLDVSGVSTADGAQL
ncbi:RICIN domain-containing protein, partial [Glycomyces rhizosphaerae]